MPRLVLDEITKRFHLGNVLNTVSLAIEPGQRVALVGESGAGKSTLLRIIAGLEQPTSGKIKLDGTDITTTPANRRGVGMVFQDYATYPRLTVAENLSVSLVGNNVPKSEKEARLGELAGWLGLEAMLKRLPTELSGGQVQRVALGKALMARPKLLLLDEPFSQLDVRLAEQMRQLLSETHARYGTTQLIVTHWPLDAMCHVDRLAVLHQGSLVHYESPAQVRAQPKTLFAAELTSPCGLNVLPGSAVPAAGLPDNVTLAFRPEAVHLANGQAISSGPSVVSWKCRLGRVNDLGIVRLQEARFGEYRMSILHRSEGPVATGDQEVHVWLARSDLMAFGG